MLKTRIKNLCIEHRTTIMKLESELGLGSGTIARWDKSSPKADTLEKVADYFGVTTDYLLGRTEIRGKQLEYVVNNHTGKTSPETDLRRQLTDEAYELLCRMPTEMQKAAIAQLKALADLNKK